MSQPITRDDLFKIMQGYENRIAKLEKSLTTADFWVESVPDGAITGAKVAGNTLTSVNIDADSINQSELGPNSVGTPEIIANAVTKLHFTTPTTSAPTTTSTSFVVLPEMTITADFGGNELLIIFTGTFQQSANASVVAVGIHDGGTVIEAGARTEHNFPNSGRPTPFSIVRRYAPAAGSRTIDVRWAVSGGTTGTNLTTQRQLLVLELRR
jgi:hypothetical protein